MITKSMTQSSLTQINKDQLKFKTGKNSQLDIIPERVSSINRRNIKTKNTTIFQKNLLN